jgi:2-polyprenyl-3-methyl-5-hydroxy-6-metoxy-1,4-benzoquinol methylase
MPFLIRSKTVRRRKRGAWQQVALVGGFLAGRHFVGAHDLHYGYWNDGLEHTIRNMPQAQEAYCQFLLQHIPASAKQILDVGCGAGGVAERLAARGHEVTCISPSSFLNSQARVRLGDKVRIVECKYEDYSTTETYDCILFCESYQYVKMEAGLDNVMKQLRPGGSLVICDFFRLLNDDGTAISGGHRINAFQEIIARYPLRLVEEIDITARTAPTFTDIDDAFTIVLKPIWDEVDRAAVATHPWIFKCVNWLFGHKFDKVKKKYFTHQRSAENFIKFKTYRLMRFERR